MHNKQWLLFLLMVLPLSACCADRNRLARHIVALEREAYLVNECTQTNAVGKITLTLDTEVDVSGSDPQLIVIDPGITFKRGHTVSIEMNFDNPNAPDQQSSSNVTKPGVLLISDKDKEACKDILKH